MQNQDRNELLGKVSAGIEAERFLESGLGKYIVARAEQERDAAIEKFKTVPPTESVTIRELQNTIWRAESIQSWIAEVIQEGFNAEYELKERERS